jgi:hypothetical protein
MLMPSIIMESVSVLSIMLSVIILKAILLNVIAQYFYKVREGKSWWKTFGWKICFCKLFDKEKREDSSALLLGTLWPNFYADEIS